MTAVRVVSMMMILPWGEHTPSGIKILCNMPATTYLEGRGYPRRIGYRLCGRYDEQSLHILYSVGVPGGYLGSLGKI